MSSNTNRSPRAKAIARAPSKNRSSSYVISVTPTAFNMLLASVYNLSLIERKYMTFLEAIRCVLLKVDAMSQMERGNLYIEFRTIYAPNNPRANRTETFSLALPEAVRIKVHELSSDLHATTGQKISHPELCVLLILAIPNLFTYVEITPPIMHVDEDT